MAQITINELSRQVESGERPQRKGQLLSARNTMLMHPSAFAGRYYYIRNTVTGVIAA